MLKYISLRREDEDKHTSLQKRLEESGVEISKKDEVVKKLNNEIVLHQNSYLKEFGVMNNEMEIIVEKLKQLEQVQKDVKTEGDRIRMNYEFEFLKLQQELKISEDKL
jgi:uncharacterized coiled-coil protein SlyX